MIEKYGIGLLQYLLKRCLSVARTGSFPSYPDLLLFDVYSHRPKNSKWPPLCENRVLYCVFKMLCKINNILVMKKR